MHLFLNKCLGPVPPTWQDMVDSSLERLKEHPAVTGARWQPSRRSFSVTPNDKKKPLEFTVKHIRHSNGVEHDGHVETRRAMTMTTAL